VPKAMMVGAKDNPVGNDVPTALGSGDAVVNIARCLGPAALLAGIAEPTEDSFSPANDAAEDCVIALVLVALAGVPRATSRDYSRTRSR
jgi:hypothetical protein